MEFRKASPGTGSSMKPNLRGQPRAAYAPEVRRLFERPAESRLPSTTWRRSVCAGKLSPHPLWVSNFSFQRFIWRIPSSGGCLPLKEIFIVIDQVCNDDAGRDHGCQEVAVYLGDRCGNGPRLRIVTRRGELGVSTLRHAPWSRMRAAPFGRNVAESPCAHEWIATPTCRE
uniref:Uncharacterized protein n=1 Tax=Trichuris muris TaxID=70415 RepID=A0A5S6QCR2_TRIMR